MAHKVRIDEELSIFPYPVGHSQYSIGGIVGRDKVNTAIMVNIVPIANIVIELHFR
jgi:hypothetical protein